MTRKWFLGLLGLGAAGQTTVTIYAPKDRLSTEKPVDPREASWFERNNVTVPYHTVEHQPCKPRNGECPVCGTMAPAFPLMKPSYPYTEAQGFFVEKTRAVSCTHCRVMFRMDAEDVK